MPEIASLELHNKIVDFGAIMIVCPWCGTNYSDFQSDCSKCGGPIQAPQSIPAPDNNSTVLMPPPPPRVIAANYQWKLMIADAWSLGAGIFALLGSIFSLVGLIMTIAIITAFVGIPFLGMGLLFLAGGGFVLNRRYQETKKIMEVLRNGEAVIGQVLTSELNYSVQVNGRNPLTIDYQFQASGKNYQGSITTLNHLNLQFDPGKPVCVLFLLFAPEYNSIYPHP
jgi:hypothetical protein